VSVIAVIPARGSPAGAAILPLERVGGISLVGRAVAAARHAESIDRVVVCTDDDLIAAEALAAGAEVLRLAEPNQSDEAVLLEAMDALRGSLRIVALILPRAPFTDPLDLDIAVARVREDHCDVSFSAIESHALLWRPGSDGVVGVNHDASTRGAGWEPASQQLRAEQVPQFEETGAFYVVRAAGFRQSGSLFFGHVEPALVDHSRALTIEGPDDLHVARAVAGWFEKPEPIDVDALVMDFDGVHTDDRVSIGGDGLERITASRADGVGIEMLQKAGYPLLILSHETNRVVTARGRKLGVEVRQGVEVKSAVLVAWAKTRGIPLSRIAYVGNDINDVGCMELVGWPIAVADANPAVLAVARVRLPQHGGHGALREVAERMLQAGPDRRVPTWRAAAFDGPRV
jgi:YrbI family 3-deoxy-D-manno-octulosonate 8-phosphate phosphatase